MPARLEQRWRAPDHLVGAIACQSGEGPIHALDPGAAVGDHDPFLRLEGDGGDAQLLLGLLALGDVDDSGEYQRPFVGFKGVQPDLDGELAAVFAQAEQVAARAHPPCFGRSKKASAQVRVLGTVPLRHQHFHLSAQQFFALVAEELFGFGVYQQDQTGRVGHHHRGRRRFDGRTKASLQPLA